MFIQKNMIDFVEYPMLHDILFLIDRIYPSFHSCYMDKNGGLAVKFDRILSDEEIRDVLFQLSAVEDTPYSPAPDGPFVMELKYGETHRFDDTITEVYSKDGLDYRC